MTSSHTPVEPTKRPFVAGNIRKFSVLIIFVWLALTAAVNVSVPSLEQVVKDHAVSLSATDAPSVQAMTHIGEVFRESDSDSVAMIVLEGDEPLGAEARKYYDGLIRQLRADTKHVQHVRDFWGDPLTAPGAQSADGKAVYVQLSVAGSQGEALANESTDAISQIVNRTPPPPGVKVYVTGVAGFAADSNHSSEQAALRILVTTFVVISVMLLLVYRSVITVIILLATVGIELAAVRGIIAFLGYHDIIKLSSFAVSILISLAIAAGTDYGIFFIGRYQEARQAGESRETAYFTAYRGVAHVVLASGLTIAGATYCLSFTRLPVFRTMGAPCALGMMIAVAAALTLVPAVLHVGGRLGLLDPKRVLKVRGWRRVGTAIVRWPAPIFVATCAIMLIGLLALPGYKVSFKDRLYIPKDTPANIGWAAAERHFSQARLVPEVLMIESDHDMRNSADFLVLDKLAKAIFRVEGIARVQAVTRPEGTPLEHTSIPALLSMQSAGQLQNLEFTQQRMDDLAKRADELDGTIASMERMYALMQQLSGTTGHVIGVTKEAIAITGEVRDHIADFDDFYRPIRNYFYWEPHCENIPICWANRSIFDSMDGVDRLTEKMSELNPDLDNIEALTPQLLTIFPPLIESTKTLRSTLLTLHSTMSGMSEQIRDLSANATAMGQDFDAARNDDSFYMPREVFDNPQFQRVMGLFMSPDGKAARFIISHKADPSTTEGFARVDSIRTAAEEALKGTPLEDANIYLTGTASTYKDLQKLSNYDLLIAAVASLCLVLIIMLIIARSLVAALVIVGTVAFSLGASFGLSVLLWQYILGFELHWLVLVMSVIILLAVGSDYNLLLVARFKEEIGAGLNTGIIRAMGGTGKVVTTAGLVFAFTMASLIVSDLKVVGQVGTTIGLGLLFDTLIVRAFLVPSIAALLGRWFWWPINVGAFPARPRPLSPPVADMRQPGDAPTPQQARPTH